MSCPSQGYDTPVSVWLDSTGIAETGTKSSMRQGINRHGRAWTSILMHERATSIPRLSHVLTPRAHRLSTSNRDGSRIRSVADLQRAVVRGWTHGTHVGEKCALGSRVRRIAPWRRYNLDLARLCLTPRHDSNVKSAMSGMQMPLMWLMTRGRACAL